MTEADAVVESLEGYYVEPETGALLTVPPIDDPLTIPSLAPYVFEWGRRFLRHHLDGSPWQYTRDQRRFLWLWYAVDDDGYWLYTSGVFRRSKGAGKDPFSAAYLLTELCGPVRFRGWTTWQGRRWPAAMTQRSALVQIGANSEAQAQDVLAVANAMVSAELKARYGFDAGKLRSNADKVGGRLQLLTTSMKTAEGDPATAILLNESHHMTRESGGHDLAAVARRNVGKSPGGLARILEMTNAHAPGKDSVAEMSHEAWLAQVKGKTRGRGLLYDSREWAPDTDIYDEESLMRGLAQSYHDAPWVHLPRIRDEVWDPRTPPGDSRRFYGNQIQAAEDAWCDPQDVKATARQEKSVEKLADGDEVVIFGDGSKSDDATGLVAVRMADGYAEVLHVQHPKKGQIVNRDAVDHAVIEAFKRFKVAAFFFDPSHVKDDDAIGDDDRFWWPLCDEWAQRYGQRLKFWAKRSGDDKHPIVFDMSKPSNLSRFVPAVEQACADIAAHVLTHDGSAYLVDHLTNARRAPGRYGVSISKEHRESRHKIDLAVCLCGARMLWRAVKLSRVGKGSRSGQGRVVVLT